MHRRPDLFPSPERFDPDRFAPAARKAMPPRAYLPFGDGPRLCLGSHLALMEGTLLLATMAPRVRLRLLPGQRLDPLAEGILRPKFGLRVLVER
jgi:cytochrome P450